MHTMHLLPGVAIQPNLELKTWPKQLLGSLLLVITLPDNLKPLEHWVYAYKSFFYLLYNTAEK
jgi:hypothetical protein